MILARERLGLLLFTDGPVGGGATAAAAAAAGKGLGLLGEAFRGRALLLSLELLRCAVRAPGFAVTNGGGIARTLLLLLRVLPA